jgi:hypothetical protein
LTKGDKAAAIENYKKSLALAPDNPMAKKETRCTDKALAQVASDK